MQASGLDPKDSIGFANYNFPGNCELYPYDELDEKL
jgi:hypothetical protein